MRPPLLPDDLEIQTLLRVGEATCCEENHHTDNDAHDDELDDKCICTDTMMGVLSFLSVRPQILRLRQWVYDIPRLTYQLFRIVVPANFDR